MNRPKNQTPGKIVKFLSAVAVAVILIGFVGLSVHLIGLRLDFSILLKYRTRIWQGFVSTVIISLGSLVISLLIGLVSAIGQNVKNLIISYLCKTYVQIIRGTPLLVQIYFFYYIVGTAWGIDNRYIAGILVLSIFEGAYISEIIRGGLESIDRQKYEIAKAIGLTPPQTFQYVTMPILLSRILPALAGQFASIIKDSSLLSVIAVIELTQTTQEIAAATFKIFENYFFVGILYFILTFTVSLISKRLEKQYNHEFRNQ